MFDATEVFFRFLHGRWRIVSIYLGAYYNEGVSFFLQVIILDRPDRATSIVPPLILVMEYMGGRVHFYGWMDGWIRGNQMKDT